MSNCVAVFDACVLYPAPLRDFLIRLARTGLFRGRWTLEIQAEWTRNLLAKRGDIDPKALDRTCELMNSAVLDCLVMDYEPLIGVVDLPDKDDRHIVAAAIRAGANAIVTFNLHDFPVSSLKQWGIEALHPDDFLTYQFDLSAGLVIGIAKEQRASLKNPPLSVDEFIGTFEKQGLPQTAARLREFAALI